MSEGDEESEESEGDEESEGNGEVRRTKIEEDKHIPHS